jgi:hypothetical protein
MWEHLRREIVSEHEQERLKGWEIMSPVKRFYKYNLEEGES